MKYTQNYQLSQWEKTDRILMEDFNTDNARIDAALKAESTARISAGTAETQARTAADNALSAQMAKLGNCQIYCATYTGNGEEQTLTFPEMPQGLLISGDSGAAALCMQGAVASRTLGISGGTSFFLTWSGNSLSWKSTEMNRKNVVYDVIALCGRG